jgi:hypothetical protein
MSTLTAEEKKARSNMLAKERNRLFREKNRDKINERRRELYELANPKSEYKIFKMNIHEDLENLITVGLQENPEDKADHTFLFYKNAFTSIIRLLDADNLHDLLTKIANEPDEICEIFDNSTQINGQPYAKNTIYSFYKSIPPVLKIAGITPTYEALKAYRLKMEELQFIYLERTQDKYNEELPSFDNYLERVKDAFGNESSKVLIVLLYKELKMRDDLGQLKIVNTTNSTSNKSQNYIVVLKNKVKVIINNFKTSDVYEPINKELSPELSKRVISYVTRKNLKKGSYLFDQQRLSPIIANINKKIGVPGSINTLRKIFVSDLHNNPTSTYKDKKQLADDMKHPLATALRIYKRTKKI